MMDYETLAAKLLAKRTDLTREALEKLVDEMVKSSPFLTRTGALLILLEKSGIEQGDTAPQPARDYSLTKIADLTPGLGRVSIIGRLIGVSRMVFSGQRRLTRLRVGDETGKVDVVCWEEKAEEVDALSLSPGDVVAIRDGYTRLNQQTGLIEVNVGRQGSVERVEALFDLPPLARLFEPVSRALESGREFVDIVGVLLFVGKAREVESESRVANLMEAVLSDGERECLLTVWGENLPAFTEFKPMDILLLTSLRRREDSFSTTARTQALRAPAEEVDSEMVQKASKRAMRGVRLRVLDVVETQQRRVIICTDGSSVFRLEHDVDVQRDGCIEVSAGVRVVRRGKEYIYAEQVGAVEQERCEGIRFEPTRISLESATPPVNDAVIVGVLTSKTPLSRVETRFGSREVVSFWLKQGDKAVGGTAWGSKAVELDRVPEGAVVELRWVSLRRSRYDELELRIDSESIIEVIEQGEREFK